MKSTKTLPGLIRVAAASTAITMASLPGLLMAQGDLAPPPYGSTPFADQALDGSGAPRPNMKSLTQTDPGQPVPSKDVDLPDLNGSLPIYTIKEPGHYYLTQNLIGDQPIVIEASDVTLDLRGFTVRLAPAGVGPGGTAISVMPGAMGMPQHVTVRNGTVSGAWDMGVLLSDYCSAEDLRVGGVLTFGIAMGAQGRVQDCIVHGPPIEDSPGFMPHAGIFGGVGAVVSNCTVRESHGHGIEVDRNSRIVDCSANCNLGSGFVAKEGTNMPAEPGYQFMGGCVSIEGCASFMNNFNGYDLGPGSSVVNCTSSENLISGFHVRAGSVLAHCTSRLNQLYGFLAESEDPVDVMDPFANNPLTPDATSFQHCSATRNLDDGFRTTVNSTFTHCTADHNGKAPEPGAPPAGIADGFDIIDSCRLVNCMASNNTDAGIRGLRENYLEQNTCHTNGAFGIVMETGANVVIRNYVKFSPMLIAIGPPTGVAVAIPGGAGGIAPTIAGPGAMAAVPNNPHYNFAF